MPVRKRIRTWWDGGVKLLVNENCYYDWDLNPWRADGGKPAATGNWCEKRKTAELGNLRAEDKVNSSCQLRINIGWK